MVYRQQELHALVGSLLNHLTGIVQPVFFEQGLADAVALGLQEGIGHAAADDDGVSLFEQVVDDGDLVGDLGAAEDSDEGALRIVQRLAHDGQLLVDQQTGISGQIGGNTCGGGMGAVNGAEGIGDKDVRHVGKGLGECRVVLFLADVKAEILEKHDLTGLQRGGLGLGILTDDVGGKNDFLSEQLGKAFGNRGQSQLGLPLALGFAEVRAGNDGGAVIKQIANGRDGGNNALVAGDLAGLLVLGNVKVAAEQDLLPFDVDIVNGLFVVVHDETS